MILNSPYISGSLTVTGNTTIQGQLTVTGSLSGTASLASNALLLQGTGSTGFATTASFLQVSSSQQEISSSLLQVSASFLTLTASYNAVSSSQQQISASLLNVIAIGATTGSNSFRADQSITGSLVVSSTITAQTLVVQTVTSSILYSSGSNVFGCDLNSRQTFTGSVLITGSLNVFGNISSSGNLRIDKDQPDIQLNITCATQYSRILFSQGASGNGGVQLIGSEFIGPRKCRFEIFSGVTGMSFVANGLFESPGMFITGSNVGIGTITPTYTLDVNGTGGFCGNINISRNANTLTRLITSNTTAGTNAYVETTFISDTSSGASAIGKYSSATSIYKIITASNTFLYNNTVAGDIAILNDFASGAIKMAAGGSCTSHLTIASTGAATFTCQVNAESFYTNDTRYISNQIMAGYNTNSEDSDIWINYTGYLGGTTRFRDFRIGNGKQGQIAVFDGSTSAATFSGTVNVYDGSSHGLSINNSSGAITFTNNWAKTTFTVGSAQDIEFNDDAGLKRLFLKNGGNVGIGTVSPGAKLDICQLGGDNARTCHALYLRAGNNSDVFNSNQILFSYNGGTDYAHAIKTRHNSNNSIDNAIDFYTWRHGDDASTKAGQYVMTIAGNGRIGIGTCQPAKPLSVWPSGGIGVYSNNTYSPSISLDFNNGTNIGHLLADQNAYYIRTLTSYPIYVQANQANGVYLSVGATSWTANSDERLKNITDNIENAIDNLLTLRTVKHTWKSDNTNKEHLALIAQDVEKVFPEVIDSLKLPSKVGEEQTDKTEYLGVRYTELIPVLVKAIQELQAQITELKNR
jgi:hypothetical protein